MSIPEFQQEIWCSGTKLAGTPHNRVFELDSSQFTIARSTDSSTPRIQVSLSASIATAASVTALDARVTTAEGDIDSLENLTDAHTTDIGDIDARLVAAESDISTLDTRVSAVEPYAVGGGLWTVTPVKIANYTAGFGEFVQVDLGGSGGADISVTLPAPGGAPPGSQIMVADVSTNGGIGNGNFMKIVATFAALASGATSPYTVASNVGARIHLIVNHDGTGWQIFSETQRP